MYYDTQHQQDHEVDLVLRFLFEHTHPHYKQQSYPKVLDTFEHLDISASYLLFSLVHERLPRRARLLFKAEDYYGKRETIKEVMQQLIAKSYR